METKRVLISGVTGMDGSHLADLLLGKGYEVFGLVRRSSQKNYRNIQHLIEKDSINLIEGDLTDQSSLIDAIEISKPDELFNMAAQSFVGTSWQQAQLTIAVTGLGPLRIMEAIRHSNMKDKIKMVQASSSEMFGNVGGILNEDSPMRPRSPYGCAKVLAHNLAKVYRESYNMWISCSICFNHTGGRRSPEFVSQKIANGVARIKLGLDKELKLGNIGAKRDWGYAPDYVDAMWMILNKADKPDDFVIASGQSHSVREFCQIAFDYAGLGNMENWVKFDKELERPAEIHDLIGDYSKVKKVLRWEPTTGFKQLVEIMVDAQIEELRLR